jgi:hypothetical protein
MSGSEIGVLSITLERFSEEREMVLRAQMTSSDRIWSLSMPPLRDHLEDISALSGILHPQIRHGNGQADSGGDDASFSEMALARERT